VRDGFQTRPAVHPNGIVYAIYYNRLSDGSSDVVIVRDDNWGSGATPFNTLVDAGDGMQGVRIVTGVNNPFLSLYLGQQRIGGDLSIAVDPNDSTTVYVCWGDQQGGTYTLYVRKSTDSGVSWSGNIRTIANATNPALAINSEGRLGLLYQQVTGLAPDQRWETTLELTNNDFAASKAYVLANTPAASPAAVFDPYIGDYLYMMAVGTSFYGIFSANNTPDLANFPNGVSYQRNADFTTKTLFANDGVTTVPVSIDPFFFRVPDGYIITKIEIDVETGSIEGAGTNGRVYLGICGREFRLDKPGDQFRVGILDNFIIGIGSNIENPNGVNDIINSPNSYEIDTYLLNIFPKYIRFEPQDNNDNWNISRVELRVTDETNIVHNFDALISNGSIWLGKNSGLLLGLS
jgi:hypothetical protein